MRARDVTMIEQRRIGKILRGRGFAAKSIRTPEGIIKRWCR